MSPLFDDPWLYRFVLQNLPIGIYVLDREQRVRFWNRGAEQITGYLAHEVMGQVCHESLPHCDPQGRILAGDRCTVTTTFRDGKALQSHVFTLHKHGHRLGVQIRTLPLADGHGVTMGVAIAFEEGPNHAIPETSGGLLCGCLDPLTGVSSQRMTRVVLSESLNELKNTRGSWGLLRVRILGLKDLSGRCGTDSIATFLRTSAQTIRHSLDGEDFLGRWGNDEFLALLPTSNPVKVAAKAALISQQISQSEILWWGDRFRVSAVVEWVIAGLNDELEGLLGKMKPAPGAENAAAAGGGSGSAASRG
jgi:diguanylate cyclase (GGDEF)-like protein/PAS domain S-box-containing protein